MEPELEELLNSIERFNEINKSDIPKLVRLVHDLSFSEKLAWAMVKQLEEQWNEGLIE